MVSKDRTKSRKTVSELSVIKMEEKAMIYGYARETELMLRSQFNQGREITPEDEIQYRFSEIHYQMNLRDAERMDAMEAEEEAKKAAKEAAEPYNVTIKSEVKMKS